MKKILTSSLVILIGIFKGYAQTAPPQGINYQAVAMDMNNRQIAGEDIPAQPVADKEIRVRFSILKDNENGTLTYREVHLVKTDAFGLFNTVIGQGIPDASPGLFDQITWETGSHFLKVEIDVSGGTSYNDLGTQQLWSVPYALYSKYANVAGNGIKSVVDNGDGSLTFTYIDGSTYKTSVLKGLAGPAGPQGPAGINGTNGVSITNSYVQNDSLYVVLSTGQTLNTGYVRGTAGKDGVGLTNSYIQNDSLYVVLSNSQILNTGHVKGKSGTNGFNALIKTTSEPKGSNCANGGTKIETGLDVNGNGALDSFEIDTIQTKYLCNSQPATVINGGSAFSNFQTFSTPGTFSWTVPSGVSKIMVECWGAGASGANFSGPYGGSAGGYGKGIYSVQQSQNLQIKVGSGGVSSPNNHGAGGSSSVDTLIISTGGTGGHAGTSTPGYSNGNIMSLKGGLHYYVPSTSNKFVKGGDAPLGGFGGPDGRSGDSPGGGGSSNTGTGGHGMIKIYW